MKNEKIVDIINKLVVINNDRIEGYEKAIEETDDHELQAMFRQFIDTSRSCERELVSVVLQHGGKPDEGTKMTGKYFRVWMDVKAALTAHDRKAILNSCEFGEDHAVKTYEEVIKDDLNDLPPAIQQIVRNQYNEIKTDHDTVKSTRDQMVSTPR